MDFQIALLLAQDGLTNGAIYALLALALVLVFAVTRVTFIPQGEFVAYGALTLASIQAGKVPATLWLLVVLGSGVVIMDGVRGMRRGTLSRMPRVIALNVVAPLLLWALLANVTVATLPLAAQITLALLIVVPLGPMIYRIAYQPIAEASELVLLIVSVAIHFSLTGLGLMFFGTDGTHSPAFTDGVIEVGPAIVQYQSLWILGISTLLVVALYTFFGRTLYGKALRATALNRTGARLMGISATMAGKLSFALAALIGAFSGILISPVTALYYDSGFLIGLKGFIGAIIGGLGSYLAAAIGALLVGFLESYASFWASAFKEVIVFTLIIPVLIWRSLKTQHTDEEE